MLYRFLDRDEVTRPIGLAFVALGLALAGLAWFFRQSSALHGSLSPDHVDFVMGLFMGIGVALEIVGISAIISGRKSKSDVAQS
jgi:hypothetical protein